MRKLVFAFIIFDFLNRAEFRARDWKAVSKAVELTRKEHFTRMPLDQHRDADYLLLIR